jgi:asparagine synthetase B (glutamine-hydrolysing)
MWLISNKSDENLSNLYHYRDFSGYYFYTDKALNQDIASGIQWRCDGHLFPRHTESIENRPFDQQSLLNELYTRHHSTFIDHIKGNFVIIQLEKNRFRIYADRFAVRKFFYWQHDQDFIITDNLKEIVKLVHPRPSKINMAVYALTYHFTGGTTLYENVKHNVPGQVIEYTDGHLAFEHYWEPIQLLHLQSRELDIKDIAHALANSTQSGLSLADRDQISLSLTGGADTRNLLATFLQKGIKPHLYTYGNPHSADCVKAAAIARGLGLNHSIHDIKMDENIFENYARKIVSNSGGLASIHRAHRLIAVEAEEQFAKWMFLGTLGGEFIKGVSEDDYIVPPIVYDNWTNNHFTLDHLHRYYENKRLRYSHETAGQLMNFLAQEPYLTGDVISRKFNALSHITAHLHDAQDVNLYSTVMEDVFTPFLDIDYLELLFSSDFTFNHKEQIKNKFLKRMSNPVYGAEFIKATYKPLLKFKYSGEHKPSEVLFNKYTAAILKRIRQKTKPAYPPNFPLGHWMEQFVANHLPACADHEIIRETFDIDALLTDFKETVHLSKESYWLKFTNPIMMRFILEEYNS